MKRITSIYRLLLIAAALIMLVGCGAPSPGDEDPADRQANGARDPRGFDPLELPADHEIVPDKYPRSGSISGKGVFVDASQPDTAADLTYAIPENFTEPVDSLNNQAYRVQIFTTKLYREAREAARVAEEIFDQRVYVDYEVPYFKVRVASFSDRDKAEEYQQKAKTAGYTSAWVVTVNINVKETAPLYDDYGTPIMIEPEDTVINGPDEN